MIPLAKVTITIAKTADERFNTISVRSPDGTPLALELVAEAVVLEDRRMARPTALSVQRAKDEAAKKA